MPKSQEALEAYRKHTGKDLVDSGPHYGPPSMQDAVDATFTGTYEASWLRTDLDMRTKSFLSMAITATLGTDVQFKRHVSAAHHLGITKEEIVGMLIHFMGYLGAPRTAVARQQVIEVWKELAEVKQK